MPSQNETVIVAPVSQEPGEPTIARLRRHGRFLFMPTLALIGLAVAWGYFITGFPELWMTLTFWIASGILAIFLFLFPLITWLGNRTIITSRRIIIYQGFFVRTRQEVLLSRIHDLTIRRNAFQGMFGSADVLLNTGAAAPVRIYDVPNASLVLSALTELVDAQTPVSAKMRREEGRWGTAEI